MNDNKFLFWIVFCLLVGLTQSQETAAKSRKIHFLDKNEAQKAIVDETIEPYFSLLQTREMSAKTGKPITGRTIEEQRKECRSRYQQSVLSFSAQERKAVSGYIVALSPLLQKQYPLMAKIPWRFIKLSTKMEGGLPHTRGGYIIFSPKFLNYFLIHNDRKHPDLFALLIHEQVHVFQRLHPEIFTPLYTRVWGFEKITKVPNNTWLQRHQLVNPDGVDCTWIFPIPGEKRWILPLIILKSIDNPAMPHDMETIAVELEKIDDVYHIKKQNHNTPVFVELASVDEYRSIFPKSLNDNIYHPNEACASLFAAVFVIDFYAEHPFYKERYREMKKSTAESRKWFRKAFIE